MIEQDAKDGAKTQPIQLGPVFYDSVAIRGRVTAQRSGKKD
jgi:hypothetical protein